MLPQPDALRPAIKQADGVRASVVGTQTLSNIAEGSEYSNVLRHKPGNGEFGRSLKMVPRKGFSPARRLSFLHAPIG